MSRITKRICIFFKWLYDSKIIKKNSVLQIKAYKHNRKPKKEIESYISKVIIGHNKMRL